MIVTLVRKPLEGSVIANSVAWGSAGVNVDGCRVTTAPWDAKAMERVNSPGSGRNRATHGGRETPEGRWDGPIGTGVMDTTQGRFPANLIMTHLTGCQWLGTVKVKGTRTDTRPDGDGGRKDRTEYRIRPTDQTRRGYSDPDGKESVESWQCEPGCPVKGLDKQSGIGTNTSHYSYKRSGGDFIGKISSIPEADHWRTETGGASRFYKNLKI